jgi:protein-tyrosine phosphatase
VAGRGVVGVTSSPNPRRGVLRLLLALLGALGVTAWWVRRNRTKQPSPEYPSAETLIRQPQVDVRVVRNPHGGLHLHWKVKAETIIVYAGTAPDNINTEEPLAVTSDVNSVTFNQLDLNQRHYFHLKFVGGAHDGETLMVAEREIPLDGTVNFRDIGGYRTSDGRYTAWGKVYRAGELHDLTEADLQRLTNLNLQTSCDLRSEEEMEAAPDKLPPGVRYVPLPVQMRERRSRQVRSLMTYRNRMDEAMIDAYTRVGIDNNPDVFGGVFKRIADADQLPLVVHCTAGKDRTGITVALLLSVLGVPDETILADYSLSNTYFETFRAVGEKAITPLKRVGINADTIQPFFTANPAVMAATLAHVREKYGSAEGYLTTQGGVTPGEMKRVRGVLLVTP